MTTKYLKDIRGNASIEYFVIAAAVALAVIAVYGKGKFHGAKAKVDHSVDAMIKQIVAP